jgi:Mg2+-importing ATPase
VQLAYLNALHETGFNTPIDNATRAIPTANITTSMKLDKEPYDFLRKRLSILIEQAGRNLLITKGALANVLEDCTEIESEDGTRSPIASAREKIERSASSSARWDVGRLGAAYRDHGSNSGATRESESLMTFAGVLVPRDPPMQTCGQIIQTFRNLGVALKMVTGDNRRLPKPWHARSECRSSRLSLARTSTK